MPTLRHAIEKYYLSIFVVSMVVMSAVLILLLHSLAIKRIDQEMLVFTNDLLRFLEKPEGQPVAIFGKKNYAFHVTEQGRTIASYNLPDDFVVPKTEGFHTIHSQRYVKLIRDDLEVIVTRNLKDHFSFLASLSITLMAVLVPLTFLVLFFGRRLTRKLTTPIEMIGEQMQLVSKGMLEKI
ncbi:hypothetical protein AJ81_07565 [Pseudothermotoga hypogea DSM 11164 = NBRC 106472]|uniref:Uncharacterized protein n=1 Tax=Pseudothermotoga hypogea DSM 11164 = NBRC 106472 TaxID=1123384 RepID=A0A0X1KU85_9THEM|nr:hypothetical protein [Pseudothermotoga hypogea]AJC74834.1 hypothetical protein AJ81_07565 [Pseudothermotoga hypogea DSM 11164 = NBRC 106472]MBC7122268.1 hypothetical protein [Pseudothermotoga sp.]